MSTTIRKNATKRIEGVLRAAVLVREFKTDDMDDYSGKCTVEHVMSFLSDRMCGIDRVYLDDSGSLHLVIHQNWSFTAYPSIAVARHQLTAPAFAKYFPAEAALEACRAAGIAI